MTRTSHKSPLPPSRPRKRNAGMTLVYMSVIAVALMGFCSLAVDLGRVEVAKTELQRTADSAARYALQGITDGTAAAKAIANAAQNTADGSAVTLLASDVEIGVWSGTAFTVTASSPNAVRVYARRLKARNTAVPLLFGTAIGAGTCDVTAVAIAYIVPSTVDSYGVFGINSVTMSSGAQADSFNSSLGAYGGANVSSQANIGSNGNVSITGGGTKVSGDVDYGNGNTITVNSGGQVTGARTEAQADVSLSNPAAPTSGYIYGGAAVLGSGSYVMPGGTYYYDSINITGGNVNFAGPATIYVNGAFSITAGTFNAYLNRSGNLKIIQLSTSPIALGGTVDLYADIYAPRSAFTISGSGELYGRIIAQSANLTGGAIHFDKSLPSVGTISGAGNVTIVK